MLRGSSYANVQTLRMCVSIDLRHSFASQALALGESLSMIGKLLGHRKVPPPTRGSDHPLVCPSRALSRSESVRNWSASAGFLDSPAQGTYQACVARRTLAVERAVYRHGPTVPRGDSPEFEGIRIRFDYGVLGARISGSLVDVNYVYFTVGYVDSPRSNSSLRRESVRQEARATRTLMPSVTEYMSRWPGADSAASVPDAAISWMRDANRHDIMEVARSRHRRASGPRGHRTGRQIRDSNLVDNKTVLDVAARSPYTLA